MTRRKRDHDRSSDQQEEVFVDDLAVAASYAVASAVISVPAPVEAGKDRDEIFLDDSSIEDQKEKDCSPDSEPTGVDEAKDETEGDGSGPLDEDHNDDDDEESEVDLAENLQLMTEENVDEEDGGRGQNGDHAVDRPKTVHEIDAYQANASELKSEFGLDLTWHEQEQLLAQQNGQLKIAGKVQHHMDSERTMVIQSAAGGDTILEEGTMLVIRVPCSKSGSDKTVPLGRILEVFGPVSQPLYSIRIPDQLPSDSNGETGENPKGTEVSKDASGVKSDNKATETAREEEATQCNGPVATKQHNDPWAESGAYTLWLRENSAGNATVYYLPNDATILDRSAILRSSGRGCDASNVFDEEITNPNDLDYSDDEQERIAKKRGKPGKQKRGGRESSSRTTPQPPRGIRHQYPARASPRRPPHPPPPPPPPQGFHQPAAGARVVSGQMPYWQPQFQSSSSHQQLQQQQQQQQQQPYYGHQQQYAPPQQQYYPQQHQYNQYPHPQFMHQYRTNVGAAGGLHGVPPPPPPPPPPPQQKDAPDTVYYDLG